MVAEHGCDTPWHGSRERISERTDEQVVDHSRLDAARADAEKSPATQVASDHEGPVKTLAEELKTLADGTKVLQQGTRGADGQTHTRFQEISSVGWEELVEVFKALLQDRVQQSSAEQTIETCHFSRWEDLRKSTFPRRRSTRRPSTCQCRKLWTFHRCSSLKRSSTSLSWRKDKSA